MKKVLGLVMCSLMLVGCGKKTAKVDNKTDIDKGGNAKEEVVVEKITFTDIKLTFDGGITTLEATMTNNTKEKKSFIVNISLIDDSGKEVITSQDPQPGEETSKGEQISLTVSIATN